MPFPCQSYFFLLPNLTWHRFVAQYVENGSTQTITMGLSKQQVGGFAGNVIAYSESFAGPFDANGDSVNKTVQSTTLDRSTQTVANTVLYPTSEQPAIQTTVGDLLVSSVSSTHGGTTLYQYDALGRRTGQKEPRHTNYATVTYNAQGQVSAITDAAGNATAYTYYGNGAVGAGQLHQETNALGQTTFHQYDRLGREIYTWGSATYPVAQGYDAYGQLNLLRTFRDTNANFAGGNFPTGANGDTTTWTYHAATGVLLQKTYADGKGPKYAYYADGALKARTWARQDMNNNPLVTTYSYTAKGELAQVDYSDTTPDVSYTYNALGQPTSITDGAGTRTFSYDATSLNLIAENFEGTVNGTLHRTYDAYNRSTGYALANAVGDDILTAATYGYDTRGRFAQINGDTVPAGITIAHSLSPIASPFTYTRAANSDLLASVTGPAHTVTNTYETNRDVLLSKENATLSNAVVSQFDYSVNPIGQRTSRSQTGTAFAAPSTDIFAYNDRGEVTGSTNSLNPVLDRAYAYDPIGNRLTVTEGTETKSYTANGLNQYLSVTSASSVVNPTCDADGNMLTDGEGKTYTWDGENRLIQVTLPNSEIVRYAYDGNSRRVKRAHFSLTTTETTTYLYNGWNVILEPKQVGSADPELKAYIWGLDLSGARQDAGGVGGLLASIAHNPTPIVSFPTYDGNGNVSDLLDDQGTLKAHYEYDAFGKETLAVGDWAQENTYRFSTKPCDDATGLNYYGHRFYNSNEGRWGNRDVIEEIGGVSLYGFVGNNGVNRWDYLGLSELSKQEYSSEIQSQIDKGILDPDEIFVALLKKYLDADKEDDWFWDCQDDMEEVFSALGGYFGKSLEHNHGDKNETIREKGVREVRNWIAGTEYRKNDKGDFITINGRPRLFLSKKKTNPTDKFGRRGDALFHMLATAGLAATWGETLADLLGRGKELKDGINHIWKDGEQDFYSHEGYSSHDVLWNGYGSELENAFDTNECDCRKLVKKFVNGTFHMSNPTPWYHVSREVLYD